LVLQQFRTHYHKSFPKCNKGIENRLNEHNDVLIMEENAKLVLLCQDDWHHVYLANLLSDKLKLMGIVVETSKGQLSRIRRERPFKDYFYAIYHKYRRKILGLNRYRKNFFCSNEYTDFPKDISRITCNDINLDIVYEFIINVKPDLIIVCGTSILKKKILSINCKYIINVHGGYLPDYRGNHCFFFALLKKDISKIGSTIHKVDEGIDTGEIIARAIPEITYKDSPESLYCKSEKLAFHILIDLIYDFQNGKDFPKIVTNRKGIIYLCRSRTPLHDIQYILMRIFSRSG